MTVEPIEPIAHRRRERRSTGGIAQLPFRRLQNPFRPLEVLSEDQLAAIHATSLRILAEVGVEVLGDRAIDRLAAAGAEIDRASDSTRGSSRSGSRRPPRSSRSPPGTPTAT